MATVIKKITHKLEYWRTLWYSQNAASIKRAATRSVVVLFAIFFTISILFSILYGEAIKKTDVTKRIMYAANRDIKKEIIDIIYKSGFLITEELQAGSNDGDLTFCYEFALTCYDRTTDDLTRWINGTELAIQLNKYYKENDQLRKSYIYVPLGNMISEKYLSGSGPGVKLSKPYTVDLIASLKAETSLRLLIQGSMWFY